MATATLASAFLISVWLRTSDNSPAQAPGVEGSRSESSTTLNPERAFTEVDVPVGPPPLTLPGVLTLPVSKQRHPAVVLLGGSGPADRDGTAGRTKILLDLAHGLAPQGVVVLRYDKRTRAHPGQLSGRPDLTLRDEYIDDALAGIALLRERAEVDGDRIFVLGHSLGASVAPRIALENPAIAGLVLMAPGLEKIEDALMRQVTYVVNLDGSVSSAEQTQLDEVQRTAQAIKQLVEGVPVSPLPFGLPRSYWLDLHNLDPISTLLRTEHPVLVMQGVRDYQVPPQDLVRWEKGLAGRPGVTIKRFPSANHAFIEGDGQSSPADYNRPAHVSPAVISDVAEWIKRSR